jgi:hypothetical protein
MRVRLLTATLYFAAPAFFRAHRFFAAATIAALPAGLSFRLGFVGALGSTFFLDSAHRFRCASAIRARPAALIFRRFRFGASGVDAASALPPDNIAFSSMILESICRFCSSNPKMAAEMISGVSLIGMLVFPKQPR